MNLVYGLWCKILMENLTTGEVWGVRRSGLIFTKKSETELELMANAPFADEIAAAKAEGKDVPATAKELLDYQRCDFSAIVEQFAKAGVSVSDPNNLLEDKTDEQPPT